MLSILVLYCDLTFYFSMIISSRKISTKQEVVRALIQQGFSNDVAQVQLWYTLILVAAQFVCILALKCQKFLAYQLYSVRNIMFIESMCRKFRV